MPQRVEGSIEVEAPVQEVYAYWQTLENLPQFMANVEEVRSTGPDTTHWRVKGPLRSEEHTSELQSRQYLVCRLLLEKKKITTFSFFIISIHSKDDVLIFIYHRTITTHNSHQTSCYSLIFCLLTNCS